MSANCLTAESHYRTPERPGSSMAAWFPGVVFYAKAFGVVYRAAGLAKKDLYDNQRWIALGPRACSSATT
jgi:hypothetical protein